MNDRQRAFIAARKCTNTRRIQQTLVMFAQGRTLEQIAQFMGLTRERIRQMILKGIRCAKL